MMLASTVQFSRYGRYPTSITAWLGRVGPTEVTSPAAVPSGPNSVLGPYNPWALAFRAAAPEGTKWPY